MAQRSRASDGLDVLQKEVGYVRKPHGGRLRVALAFPNTYFVGMSNLGFQTIYRLFNELDDVVCERVCLPGRQELAARLAGASREPLRTIESGTPVRDFDVFAFSVSFEWDYTNVVSMLRLAGMPVRAAARTRHDPLVVIGGAVTFVNPEPLALFADVIAAGEGEVLVPSLMTAIGACTDPRRPASPSRPRTRLLRAVVLRRRLQGRRHDRVVRPEARYRGSGGGEEGRRQEHRADGSALDPESSRPTPSSGRAS